MLTFTSALASAHSMLDEAGEAIARGRGDRAPDEMDTLTARCA
jgi:hypothetical protein